MPLEFVADLNIERRRYGSRMNDQPGVRSDLARWIADRPLPRERNAAR